MRSKPSTYFFEKTRPTTSKMDKIFYKLSPTAQRALLEGPALHPPQDVLPNFANPPNRREAGWAVIILSIVLSSSAVAIRMYSKIFCMKKMELEDCKQTLQRSLTLRAP